MARCGRCGLWSKYGDNHHEQKYAGVCLWYQHRLIDEEVFEERKCVDFFERVPGLTPLDHFDYKAKRDDLGKAYRTARFSRNMALAGMVLSILSLLWSFLNG
jgi:hypothetical protein